MPLILRAVILWLHLVAVIIWIGGLVFQVLVVFPVLGRGALAVERFRFSLGLEARFRTLMWPVVGMLLFTGLVNLMNVWHATSMADGTFSPMFVWLLSVKLLLVLGMLALQAVQQFFVQPRCLAALGALTPGGQEFPLGGQELPRAFLKWQRLALILHVMLLGLAAAAVWCAVLLRGA